MADEFVLFDLLISISCICVILIMIGATTLALSNIIKGIIRVKGSRWD